MNKPTGIVGLMADPGWPTGIVGLMADPGWPTRIANKIADQLAEELTAQLRDHWEVEVAEERLPLDSDGEIPLFRHAPELQDAHGWDYLLYLTDLPLLKPDEILLGTASAEEHAALISLPSLGATRSLNRVRKIAVSLITASYNNFQQHPSGQNMEGVMGPGVSYQLPGPEDRHAIRISLSGFRHRLGLFTGTIRSNHPTRMLGALTNSIALGSATGAFGIFYGSVWELAENLQPWRLLLISMTVIAMMGFWLILKNSLWAPARKFAVRWQSWMDILTTTTTIAIGASLVYFSLFGVLLLLALVVVESGYLAEQLGHAVGFGDYLDLAWLSSSLGMLAGALGSNFNSPESIREATYSNRVYERRQLADDFENSSDTAEQD